MIKQIGLLTKKPEMTQKAFIDRYEQGHVPLINEILSSFFVAYSRDFPIAGDTVAVDFHFDALTQLWYRSGEDLGRAVDCLSDPAIGARISEDETHLFDRSKVLFFSVDEYGSNASPPSASDIKLVSFSKKPAGIERKDFIARMENDVVPEMLRIAGQGGQPAITACRRNYAIPDGSFEHQLYEGSPRIVPDAITEIWFTAISGMEGWVKNCTASAASMPDRISAGWLRSLIDSRIMVASHGGSP